jgi:P-type Na+/K+ transporter
LTLAFVAANIGIGFFHEYQAERAMEWLKKLSSHTATVLRCGTVKSTVTSEVAVGDIVELRTGQIVPADLCLFWTFDLQIDESLLTGESLAVLKGTEVLPKDRGESPSKGECSNLAFAATVVTNGQGRGIVYATGMKTEMSKMAETLGGNGAGSMPARISLTKKLLVVQLVSTATKVTPLHNKLTEARKIGIISSYHCINPRHHCLTVQDHLGGGSVCYCPGVGDYSRVPDGGRSHDHG